MRLRSLFAAGFTAAALVAFAQDAPVQPAPPPGAQGGQRNPGMRGQGAFQRQPRLNGEITAITADSITVKVTRRPFNFQRGGAPGAVQPGTPAAPGAAPAAPQAAETVTTHTVKTNAQTTYFDFQRRPLTRASLKVGANIMVQYVADASTPAPAGGQPPAPGTPGAPGGARRMPVAPAVVTAQSITLMPAIVSGTLVGATATAVTIRDAAGKYQVFTITPTTVVTNNGVAAKATELKTNTVTFVQAQDKTALQVYQGTPPRGGFGAFGGMRAPGVQGRQNDPNAAGARQGRRGNRGGDTGNTIAPPIDTNSPE